MSLFSEFSFVSVKKFRMTGIPQRQWVSLEKKPSFRFQCCSMRRQIFSPRTTLIALGTAVGIHTLSAIAPVDLLQPHRWLTGQPSQALAQDADEIH